MIATSFSRRALLRSGGLAALGLAAQGCSKFVVTLYPYMGNDLRMIATDLSRMNYVCFRAYCRRAGVCIAGRDRRS